MQRLRVRIVTERNQEILIDPQVHRQVYLVCVSIQYIFT